MIDNLPATDTGGYAGLADEVDLHTWKLLKGVALATVLGVGSQLAFGSSDSDLVKALQQSTQSTTNRAGQRLVERNLNVAADHHRAARLAAARDRAQGHRAAALPRKLARQRLKEESAMPVIGTFSAVKDGYAGTIRTLTMTAKVSIVANDRKEGDGAPDFRIMAGDAEIGAAWRRTKQGSRRDLPARQARRSHPAAADLGRLARGDRGRRGPPAVAARPEGGRLT